MRELTARQEQILGYIKDYLRDIGYPPTRSEIAREMGFKSANAAEEHLRALARKGAIEMAPGASRGIRLPPGQQPGLPVIGRVAAGSPVLAEESIAGHWDVPPELFSPAADYLLTVVGESMIGIGIYADDLLAVHKTCEAANGDIVVARIDNEVTVKRFERSPGPDGKFRLIAENPDYPALEFEAQDAVGRDFAIEGISVGVIRRSL